MRETYPILMIISVFVIISLMFFVQVSEEKTEAIEGAKAVGTILIFINVIFVLVAVVGSSLTLNEEIAEKSAKKKPWDDVKKINRKLGETRGLKKTSEKIPITNQNEK